jgi:hypothetical protein
VGLTDLKAIFGDVDKNPNQINGISLVHGVRIVARPGALPSKTGVDINYKEDYSRGEDWLPLPASTLPGVGNFDALFRHPDHLGAHGEPIVCRSSYPVVEKRQRQQWVYDIGYSDGSSHQFTKPCPSLPYELSRDDVKKRFTNPCRQAIKPSFHAKLGMVRRNILTTLTNRCDEDKHWPSFDTFFNSLPHRKEDAHSSYYNAMSYLMEKFGGDVVVPPRIIQAPRVVLASDFICPISFANAPVSINERTVLSMNAMAEETAAIV